MPPVGSREREREDEEEELSSGSLFELRWPVSFFLSHDSVICFTPDMDRGYFTLLGSGASCYPMYVLHEGRALFETTFSLTEVLSDFSLLASVSCSVYFQIFAPLNLMPIVPPEVLMPALEKL